MTGAAGASSIAGMSLLIGPGEGRHLGGRFDVLVRVRAEHTGGVMAVLEETIPQAR